MIGRNKVLSLSLLIGVCCFLGGFVYGGEDGSSSRDGLSVPGSVLFSRSPLIVPPYRDQPAEVVFSEDFENEIEGWSTSDLTNNVVAWHKSDFLVREEGDLLWWCGDTITDYENPYVGYNNIWLQYLDTPILDLSQAEGNITLTFDAYWLLEDPRRVPPPQPYDGWDGWLVLLSVDGGERFSIITPESPAYTARRLSAAERFWMLPGEWPGWVYHSGEWGAPDEQNPRPSWVQCRFNLSDYREEEVVVRFMLVTDRAVAAPWNAYLANSGVLVDNILIEDEAGNTFLWNNGVDDPIPEDLIPRRGHGFGDHWSRTEQSSHSGRWSMWNDDDHFNLINALDTPPIEIPQGYNTHFQFWVWCDLPDAVHQGAQVLSDFYQIYLSNDGGETWTYQTHDYSRPESGGNGWTHYVPGVPWTGNTELSLTQYAGQEIQLRWLFRTDNDHREGNGRGLFIDDVEVIALRELPRDVGMKNLTIPYPLIVGYRLTGLSAYLHNFGTRDQSNIYSWWGWTNGQDARQYPTAIPYPSVPAGDSLRIILSDFVDRRNPGLTPLFPGSFTIWAATRLGANTPADPNDDDMNRANDSIAVTGVRVWPSGIYELGYDARSIRYAYNFGAGRGPACRFSPQGVGLNRYHLVVANMTFAPFNPDLDIQFRLHIFTGGQGDNPGDEIFTQTINVPLGSTYPNILTIPLSQEESLHNLEGDFWIWCEIIREDNLPQIVGDIQRLGVGRFFSYDGQQTTAIDQDLQIHAMVIPVGRENPAIQPYSTLVDFVEVPIGSSASRQFSLYSTGLEPLVIQNIYTTNDAFLVDWLGDPVTLATGESVTFDIVFAPSEVELYAGLLVVECNAEHVPEISLVGSGSLQAKEDRDPLPYECILYKPFPNPFNGRLVVNFFIPFQDKVTIGVFSVNGQLIEILDQEVRGKGYQSLVWDASALPSGVYLIGMETRGIKRFEKAVLIK